MNIFFTIGGKGERFKNAGYKQEKPMINVFEKPLFFYVLDELNIGKNDNIYIIYNRRLDNQYFSKKITEKYPDINMLPIDNETNGAAETIYIGLNKYNNIIKRENKNIILDCDTIYREDIIDMYRKSQQGNIVFYTEKKKENPIYSYIEIDDTNRILNIMEKTKISNNANTGAYCFQNLDNLNYFCKYIIDNNIMFNNELYTSCVIYEMIKKNNEFYGIEINDNDVISLGTPELLGHYIDNTNILLFDLDGTLVNTDPIYIKVWDLLLKKFNINCDKKFFDFFIKGKSDEIFLKYINSNLSQKDVQEISKEKDNLFVNYLLEEKNILIEGAFDFIRKHRHDKIAIVTSCNRHAAKSILEFTGLDRYIDILIASEDCNKHKPNPEPYINAIEYFNVSGSIDNVFIFEDSYSGYSSALRTHINNIALIENENSSNDILNSNAFKYKNYTELSLCFIKKFYDKHHLIESDHISDIKQTMNTKPINCININNKSLKTGYICDIKSYNIQYKNGDGDNIILKISNLENELSNTALKLNMYENETYFYKNISLLIDNTPKYYGSFKDNKKDAIILENMHKYNGVFNIDLNTNISTLLNVIKSIFKIHSTFWFNNESDIIPCMKSLKKINNITHFKELIYERYDIFKKNTQFILSNREKTIIEKIYNNIEKIYNTSSEFPLSFCHGDFKSPNIFYKDNKEPILLDWQYIHLNKGVSDIVFLLIESIDFDIITVELVINYYYKLQNELYPIKYETYMSDFKNALCVFPLFVCIWFNSETSEKLIDPIFPIKFMKNMMKYYSYFLD